MTIYDKPTKELMREFSQETLTPGQTFDKNQAVAWFRQKYPNIKPNTITMHVEGMATNSTLRKHYRNIKRGSGHDLFFKVGPGRFRLWDPPSDPQPLYPNESASPEEDAPGVSGEPQDAEDFSPSGEGSREFGFERDLRNYLSKNLYLLERGLKLYQEEDFSGVEFPVGGRFIDILAVDNAGRHVVIELKVSRGYDRVIGHYSVTWDGLKLI
jgi:hypothetical protein